MEKLCSLLDPFSSVTTPSSLFQRSLPTPCQDDPESVTVELSLEEKKWYKVNAATYFQGGENSCEMGAGLHNLRGCAEHITATAEYGSENSSQASLVYEQPRIGGLPILVSSDPDFAGVRTDCADPICGSARTKYKQFSNAGHMHPV